jgi:hypothetical protein
MPTELSPVPNPRFEAASASAPEPAPAPAPDMVSVIVPVSERPEPLDELYREFAPALRQRGLPFEFIFIAEPGSRHLLGAVAVLIADGEPVRLLTVGQSVGETMLIRLAVAEARGDIILTLPAYRRVEAPALPALVEHIQLGADLALARRWPRRDPWINRFQNRVLHSIIGGLAGGKVHDVACGVRAFRRSVLAELPLYGDFGRFLPILALREGFRVDELPFPQHPRESRLRLYAPGVYLRRLIDLLGLFFLARFTDKPLRFFGLIGAALALVGSLVLGIIAIQRFQGQAAADRPLLLLGVLLLVLGVQAIALGLIGEIIVHLHASKRRTYRVRSSSTG